MSDYEKIFLGNIKGPSGSSVDLPFKHITTVTGAVTTGCLLATISADTDYARGEAIRTVIIKGRIGGRVGDLPVAYINCIISLSGTENSEVRGGISVLPASDDISDLFSYTDILVNRTDDNTINVYLAFPSIAGGYFDADVYCGAGVDYTYTGILNAGPYNSNRGEIIWKASEHIVSSETTSSEVKVIGGLSAYRDEDRFLHLKQEDIQETEEIFVTISGDLQQRNRSYNGTEYWIPPAVLNQSLPNLLYFPVITSFKVNHGPITGFDSEFYDWVKNPIVDEDESVIDTESVYGCRSSVTRIKRVGDFADLLGDSDDYPGPDLWAPHGIVEIVAQPFQSGTGAYTYTLTAFFDGINPYGTVSDFYTEIIVGLKFIKYPYLDYIQTEDSQYRVYADNTHPSVTLTMEPTKRYQILSDCFYPESGTSNYTLTIQHISGYGELTINLLDGSSKTFAFYEDTASYERTVDVTFTADSNSSNGSDIWLSAANSSTGFAVKITIVGWPNSDFAGIKFNDAIVLDFNELDSRYAKKEDVVPTVTYEHNIMISGPNKRAYFHFSSESNEQITTYSALCSALVAAGYTGSTQARDCSGYDTSSSQYLLAVFSSTGFIGFVNDHNSVVMVNSSDVSLITDIVH